MKDIISKISFCPVCGKKLVKAYGAFGNVLYSLCPDSGCRFSVLDNECAEIDLLDYSKLMDKVDNVKVESKTFLLLKNTLSGPMLQKLTNDAMEKDRCMYCVITAKNKEDALAKFRRKFTYVKITDEMVIPIIIKEEGW